MFDMKKRLLLYVAVIALFAASCKKGNDNFIRYTDTAKISIPKPYTIIEDFEEGSKSAYAAADITLSTGSWNFDDALIGNLAADNKNGTWSVRMRNGKITMNFDVYNLSKIVLKHAKYGSDAAAGWTMFISRDKGATWTQFGAEFNETNTTFATDSFYVATSGPVRFQIRRTSGSTTARTNFDDITFKGAGDAGVIFGTPDTNGADTTNTSKPATGRPVVIGADAPPASGDNSNLLFGNPSGATTSIASSDNYLIDQSYYVESYNATRGEPNWVSWHLDATNTTNVSDRLNNFAAWSGLPTSFYAVQSNSYSGSGFDRGHNCPSADRTSSAAANGATFLMTNMIPQAPQNNQQTWGNLENYLRLQVSGGNEVYIIMGSYGSGGVGSLNSTTVTTINSGHVAVPSNVWKVAVVIPVGNGDIARVSATTRVIAVNTPNINSINSDWTKYIVTVRDIEKATGYNILSALPQTIQDAVENKKDAGN
jgi:endonuclease G